MVRPTCNKIRIDSHARLLAQSARHIDLEQTRAARMEPEATLPLARPEGRGKLGHASRIRSPDNPERNTQDARSFQHATATLNILRQCAESLRSAALGVERYAALRDLISMPSFPPSVRYYPTMRPIFATGKTSPLYLSHLRKAFQILDIPSDWYTPSIRAIASGLKNAKGLSNTYDNYMFRDTCANFTQQEQRSTEFGVCAI